MFDTPYTMSLSVNETMQKILVSGIAFLFGFCATYAGTKSLIAVGQRHPLSTANWGLLVNTLSWSAVLLVVFTNNIPAVILELAGCWLADYLVVERQRRLDAAARTVHRLPFVDDDSQWPQG